MFDQLGDGVFRRRYESLDLNVGVVLGEDGILIVDTRSSHQEAEELVRDLRGLTDLPVRWVVNTHWHWDHAFGNAVFTNCEIWGHDLCRSGMERFGERMKLDARHWLPESQHAEVDEVVVVPPDRTFSDRVSLAIGRSVDLTYHGLAHTDADIVVRVPGSEVAFFGDMIEESGPPNFGDSFPLVWPATLGAAMADLPAVAVPGHGDVVDEVFVRSQLEDLAAVAALCNDVTAGHLDLETAAERGPYPEAVMRSALERVPSQPAS
jgi:glyoxylase-like metal-dependent hydrolase (beta-lactamase superfamily II)